MKQNSRWVLVLVCTFFITGTVAAADTATKEKREEVRKQTAQTLATLYEVQPSAKSAIEKAAGYAAFSNFGMKILVAGGGKGRGIAVDKSTGKETFMRMVEIQAGLGFGIKKFRVVFVFDNQTELNKFIESGWQLGGQGTVAAKASGGAGRLPVRCRCHRVCECTS